MIRKIINKLIIKLKFYVYQKPETYLQEHEVLQFSGNCCLHEETLKNGFRQYPIVKFWKDGNWGGGLNSEVDRP